MVHPIDIKLAIRVSEHLTPAEYDKVLLELLRLGAGTHVRLLGIKTEYRSHLKILANVGFKMSACLDNIHALSPKIIGVVALEVRDFLDTDATFYSSTPTPDEDVRDIAMSLLTEVTEDFHREGLCAIERMFD